MMPLAPHHTRRLTRRLAIACLSLSSLLMAPRAHAEPSFLAPYLEHPGGTEATSVGVADFDSDGRLDAALSDGSTGEVRLMLQQADHRFLPGASFAAGYYTHELVCGDFNGDGHADIAALSYGDSLVVLEGDGTGAFPVLYTRPVALGTGFLAVADLDGAAPQDLVVLSYSSATLETFVGVPGGALAPRDTVGTLSAPAGLGIGDLDGDGRDDIALSHEFVHQTELLFNGGAGIIAASATLPFSPPYGTGIAVHDMDGDGRRDILVNTISGDGFGFYRATGPGTFDPATFVPASPTTFDFTLLCPDVDGDGDADVVVGGTEPRVYLNDGTATFTAAPGAIPANVLASSHLVAADFDGDGHPDLLTSGSYGAWLCTLAGHGDGTFGDHLTVPSALGTDLLFADLDGDAYPDLALADGFDAGITVQLGTPAGLGAPVLQPLADVAFGLTSGRFDGDGVTDLATVTRYAGDLQVFTNDGTGSFPTVTAYPTGNYPSDLVAGDLDADGLDDIVVVCSPPPARGTRPVPAAAPRAEGLLVFMNSATGFLPPAFLAPTGSCPNRARLGDVDGDGILDLAVTMSCSGTVEVFTGTGGGAFAAPVSIASGISPADLELVDLDGDGVRDLVVVDGMGELLLHHGTGGGGFALPVSHPTVSNGQRVVVADFDADGARDVAVLSVANLVAVHAGVAGGGLGTRTDLGTCASAAGLVAHDFDRDGRLDLLDTGTSQSALQFLRNAGGATGGVEGPASIAEHGPLSLRSPMPNPARGAVTLEFRLGAPATVSAELLDLSGRVVRTLATRSPRAAGPHHLTWDLRLADGARAPSGVYFARVRAGDAAVTRKVFVTR